MMKGIAILLGSLLNGVLAIPRDTSHERRNEFGPQWARADMVNADFRVPVRIALKQRNVENGMSYLMDVSDPQSANYGKHYSQQQVIDLFAPSHETTAAVKSWLVQHGIPPYTISSTKGQGWLDFTTTIGKLEKMLQAKFHFFSRNDTQHAHVATEKYVLPADISPHVDFIQLAMAVPNPRARKATSPVALRPKAPIPEEVVQMLKANPGSTQYCDKFVTPACIKAMYHIPDGTGANPANRLGIYESNNDLPLQSDLAKFYGLFATTIPPATGPQVDLIDYGKLRPNTSAAFGEGALDFGMAQPILYPQSTVLFQTHTNYNYLNGTYGIFNQFLDAIDGCYCTSSAFGETGDSPTVDGNTTHEACGTFTPTNVISISWGLMESLYPAGYLERQCDEFLKLGLQGSTVVFDSGDGGVAGIDGYDCLGEEHQIFNPIAPATCPYVTAVGATAITSGKDIESPQVASRKFASGGGFSNVWTRPTYQQSAVATFFNKYDPNLPHYSTSGGKIPMGQGVYNRAGRAFPDVAAIGENGVVVFNDQVITTYGTSMSTPILASIFTRINEELLARGHPRLGFVNPLLYANPSAFNDVTIGSQGITQAGACAGKSFSTAPGWDPVTGLGTPNYPALLEVALSQYRRN